MPTSSRDPIALAQADLAACQAAIKQGSRSFYAASALLPERVRAPAFGLYAFCRLSDDEVDETEGGPEAIARLQKRLNHAYAGEPGDEAADRMLSGIVQRHAIPRQAPESLIEGLAWDVAGRRYETLPELRAYCARVAGSVGVMMTLIMGVRSPEALARASDLGVAMQLTNIVRDVGEDARHGRIYLPLSWLREAGIDPEAWLARPVLDERLRAILRRLLEEADLLYRRAGEGVAFLPPDCRPAIHAARLIYAEIGREAERSGLDVLTRRARVAGPRKAALLLKAIGCSMLPRPGRTALRYARALPENAFLLDAVVSTEGTPAEFQPEAAHAWWDLSGRFARVLDLFERLQQRERSTTDGRPGGAAWMASISD
jgi:phytoene synthase